MKITGLSAKTILDSKGKPTIELSMQTNTGVFISSVPSGVSKGEFEALEIPAEEAVKNIDKVIILAISKKDFSSQKEFDNFLIALDGTANKAKLGGNTLLALSLCFCRALSSEKKMPLWQLIAEIAQTKPALPKPMLLCFEGGKHGESGLSIQEFMVTSNSLTFEERLQKTKRVYQELPGILLKDYSLEAILGLEGGFASTVHKTENALAILMKAIEKTNQKGEISICLDAAASEFCEQGKYHFEEEQWQSSDLADFYRKISQTYPIVSIEDPFAKKDTESWQEFLQANKKLLVVGDDLTATNPEIIKKANQENLCNAVIIKPNQIGTVSEAITAANLARSFNWQVIVSHRGGETNDNFIADLSVGLASDYIKTGGPTKPERKAKYDRLIEIEKEINS